MMKGKTLGVVVASLAVPALMAFQFQPRDVPDAAPVAQTPSEQRILGVLEKMVANRELHLPVSPRDGRLLRMLAETAGAKHVVEIGTSTGYSSLWLCLALQATGGRLTTFELDPGRAAQARQHFEQAGVDGLVKIVVGDAHENVKRLEAPIDLLFLDADKDGYPAYLKQLLPLIRPGGVIAADNVNMAPEFVKAVTSDGQFETVFLDRFGVTLKKRPAAGAATKVTAR
jgi:predicted O-methyltransferase YrrM